MALIHVLLLALIQGITEFLPISSSAHLILFPALTGSTDQGILVDIAVHVGTLFAVLIYFRHDVAGLFRAAIALVLRRDPASEGEAHYRRLLIALIIGTVPIVIVGFAFERLGLTDVVRSVEVIAWATIIFAIVLYVIDQRRPEERDLDKLTWKDGLIIGASQILALIPGTSRSGITMTLARKLNYTRTDAARFSMLLSIPTIAAAGVLAVFDLTTMGSARQIFDATLAAGLSFLVAIGAIHYTLKWLQHASMTIFVVYRLILGVGLLVWAWT